MKQQSSTKTNKHPKITPWTNKWYTNKTMTDYTTQSKRVSTIRGKQPQRDQGTLFAEKNDMQNLFDTFKMQIKYDKDSLNSIVDLE